MAGTVKSVLLGGPIGSGTTQGTATEDVGLVVLAQSKTITVPTTATTLDTVFYLPASSQIIDIIFDLTVAADSGTSAGLTVGLTSTGTDYASSFNAKGSTGRTRPTFTAAQLTAMSGISTNTAVYATVVTVGTGTVGTVVVTIVYQHKNTSL